MKFPRWIRYAMLALLIPGVLLAALLTVPAYAAHTFPAPIDPVPKGVWNVTVHLPQGTQEHSLALYFPGTARKGPLLGGAYTQTDLQGTGLGDWEQTSGTTFQVVYIKQVTKALADGQQVFTGTQHVHLQDTFTSPTAYTGQGEMVRYDVAGRVISHTAISVQAVFVPDSDPNWF